MTDTQTLTITAFVLERLAEGEAAARASYPVALRDWAVGPNDCPECLEEDGLHTPECYATNRAYILATCTALRAVVELHTEDVSEACSACALYDHPCPTLRALAAIWSDHETWREEWAL